ncbi:UNVERIFIED_CONTAM: hypothetical protein Sradi_6856500 [Sesamum radiatum]|uniref:Uncharacterized protein n=1 Tax=Sesamum radiatum TaxID=300843 RepID=A0AAW2JL13_SESRA
MPYRAWLQAPPDSWDSRSMGKQPPSPTARRQTPSHTPRGAAVFGDFGDDHGHIASSIGNDK